MAETRGWPNGFYNILMPRYLAVLFDLDGTLVDSYAAITASVNHVRRHYHLPPLSEGTVRGLVGHGLTQLMRSVVPDADPADAVALYHAHHPEVIAPLTRLLPGVAVGLPRLRQAGIRLGVCSNKPLRFTRDVLRVVDLLPLFDVVLGPEDVGVPKPDPAMLHAALDRLAVAPARALYVGDMVVDIETGRRAHVETWVVPTGSQPAETLRAALPDRVLPDLAAVVAAILEPAS